METYPLWKSLYYENATASSVEYRVLLEGENEIFRGKAHRSPETGKIKISLNEICASYMDSLLEESELRRSLGVDTLIPTNAYMEFTLEIYNTTGSRWDQAMEWAMTNDTSWLQRNTGEGTYSEPINGHGAPDQMLAFSYLVTYSQTQTVCYNGTSIYFVITRGQAEELPDSGGTWEIDYDTNLENTYYEMKSLSSSRAPVTGYTSGGTISFELSANTDAFQEEYEVIFYSGSGGTMVGTAVAYIGAGEGGGFTHFLRITSAPSYVYSAGTSATFEFRTNCDGGSHWELFSSSTQGSGYQLTQSGNSSSLSSITVQIPANTEYSPRYFKIEISASDSDDPYNWLVSDYTEFTQQDRQHYFFFTTEDRQALPYSATTNTITWATDYDEIKWELNLDNSFVSSGTSNTGGAMLTFAENRSLDTLTYTLNCFTTGGTQLGTITFFHLDEAAEYAFEYLGFEALSAGTIGITSTHDPAFTIEYSKNNGEWTEISTTANSLNVAAISVNHGDRVRFRGNYERYSTPSSGLPYQSFHFVISGTPFDVYGNILSLTYGDNFSGATAPAGGGAYAHLFSSTCGALRSAQNLYLPAPNDADYYRLFFQCSGLTTPPKIPAATAPHSYREMFGGCKALQSAPSLPATSADQFAYYGMFQGCSGLTAAPHLPATTVGEEAYAVMFQGCSGLTAAPHLPATTVGEKAYLGMFRACKSLTAPATWDYSGGGDYACMHMYSGCTALQSAPDLPAANSYGVYYGMFDYCTALTSVQSALTCTGDAWSEAFSHMFARCSSLQNAPSIAGINLIPERAFEAMFLGCSGLTAAPSFPGQYATLGVRCFQDMFEGCAHLATAPSLPWTALTEGCYAGMFRDCDSLTTAPSLPATTLAKDCYAGMFQQCSLLTTAPILRAATVPQGAYSYMFNWCRRLDYIECLATDISAEDSTLYFAYNTANTGVFVKAAAMTAWEEGYNGIPTGWTVESV